MVAIERYQARMVARHKSAVLLPALAGQVGHELDKHNPGKRRRPCPPPSYGPLPILEAGPRRHPPATRPGVSPTENASRNGDLETPRAVYSGERIFPRVHDVVRIESALQAAHQVDLHCRLVAQQARALLQLADAVLGREAAVEIGGDVGDQPLDAIPMREIGCRSIPTGWLRLKWMLPSPR